MERYIAIVFCTIAIMAMAVVMRKNLVITNVGVGIIWTACIIVGGFMVYTLRLG